MPNTRGHEGNIPLDHGGDGDDVGLAVKLLGQAVPAEAHREGKVASEEVIDCVGDTLLIGGDTGVGDGKVDESKGTTILAFPLCIRDWHAATSSAWSIRWRCRGRGTLESIHDHCSREIVHTHRHCPGEGEVVDSARGKGDVANVVATVRRGKGQLMKAARWGRKSYSLIRDGSSVEEDWSLVSCLVLWGALDRDDDSLSELELSEEGGITRHTSDVPP